MSERLRGEQYDNDLGLYCLRARYYNPATGRFLSRDPEDGKPVDPKTLQKYLYAGGNPIDEIDPLGRFSAGEYFIGLKKVLAAPATVFIANSLAAACLAQPALDLVGVDPFVNELDAKTVEAECVAIGAVAALTWLASY